MTDIHSQVPPARSALDVLIERCEVTGLAKGLQQGLQQGLQGLRNMLTAQLRQKFGSVADDVLARIAAADADTLQAWALRVLPANSADEVVADRAG